MPGVPSSRACEVCRSRRKRCDQAQPKCTRCQRLQTPCVGGGVRRFIFKTLTRDATDPNDPIYATAMSTPQPKDPEISRMPSSPSSTLSMAFVDKLQRNDLRQDINWAHGPFMDEIPKRLEHSRALAAAADAFMLATPRTDISYTLSRQRLRSYSAALRATRLALLNRSEAQSPLNMCAIYFLWACQSWLGIPDQMGVHAKGLAQSLNQAPSIDYRDGFDRGVVYVSCSAVTSEKLLHPDVNVDHTSPCWSFFNTVVAQTRNIYASNSLGGGELALTQRLSRMLSGLSVYLLSARSVVELWHFYTTVTAVVAELSQRIGRARDLLSPSSATTSEQHSSAPGTLLDLARLYEYDKRSYSLSLTVALLMSDVLSIHYPNIPNLAHFRRLYACEAPELATQAGRLKPIGAGFVGLYLSAVWTVSEVPGQVGAEPPGTSIEAEVKAQRLAGLEEKLEETLQTLLSN